MDDRGNPAIIPNSYGDPITPSVIQFSEGEIIVGEDAYEALKAGDTACAAGFKRFMGSAEPCFFSGGKEYTAQELSSILLAHLKKEVEAAIGGSIDEAVITVPAYFFSAEREATLNAAKAAGINVKKLIDEPNAAALAYGLDHWRENANILVYDLGGGTFDVTLVRMDGEGELKTISTKGNHILGGKDWDERLASLIIEKFVALAGPEIRRDVDFNAAVRGLSEHNKKRLSSLESVKISLSLPVYGKETVELTKSEFEDATRDLLEKTGHLCQFVLNECGLTIHDITDILLVGGSSRMPQVSEFLESMFGKKPIAHVNPDEAVALGAAIQATKGKTAYVKLAQMQGEDGKKVVDVLSVSGKLTGTVESARRLGHASLQLRETTAHAMGIIAIDEEKNSYYNEIIIPANHPRPVRAAKRFRFHTFEHKNNELAIFTLQGDKENPLDCRIANRYVVSGIHYDKNDESLGTVIRVQYSYDDNGIIQIQARQGQGKKDLPIRKESVPADVSQFGEPVKRESLEGTSLAVMGAARQDVVHKYREVTFSNVAWQKYDNITDAANLGSRPASGFPDEPRVHVIADEKDIQFHGYNVSAMDEGVYYSINPEDDFEIQCEVDTTFINPHPGGSLSINLGIIRANLNQHGGEMKLDGKQVASVGSQFRLTMSVTSGGHYEIAVNDQPVAQKDKKGTKKIDVKFGFEHGSHFCNILSHAFISNIEMKIRSGEDSGSSETETWE